MSRTITCCASRPVCRPFGGPGASGAVFPKSHTALAVELVVQTVSCSSKRYYSPRDNAGVISPRWPGERAWQFLSYAPLGESDMTLTCNLHTRMVRRESDIGAARRRLGQST